MTNPTLCTYSDFKDRLGGGISLRTIRRMMARGEWPQGARLSAHGPILWDAQIVHSHIDRLLAGLEVAA